jgi:gluconolactonase
VAEPEGEYLIVEPAFRQLIARNMRLVRLWTGGAWTEGPVYFGDANILLFSDIPNDRLLRFVPDHTGLLGAASVYRQPASHANGHTRDREGRLVSCEHGGRRVTRTELDGRITVIADRWGGKRLNSPNDVVVKSDGTIWFTDPLYGIRSDLEGFRGEPEYGGAFVFCVDPRTGELRVAVDDFVMPNGLAFSPDERVLYIADSGATFRPDGPRHIRAFEVDEGNRLRGGGVLAVCDAGRFDGLRADTGGRLWAAANDGVHCLAPAGELLGKILVPEVASNVCFGGPKRNRLFITATTSLYAVYTHVNGAQRP